MTTSSVTLLLSVVVILVLPISLAIALTNFNRRLERLDKALVRIEQAAAVVAENLAASVSRADATDGPEGAAADAALRTGDTAEWITARQEAVERLRERTQESTAARTRRRQLAAEETP